ncbi:MAG: hypothetical protein CMM85_19535 [Rhodothermaceae bacterium]|nr:hypothetical protein [Rhodothermaceae bacterium]
MRPFVLLSLFLAVAAQAQDREPAFLPRAAVVTVGVAGGVGAVVGAYYLIPSWYDTPHGAALLVLSYPAGGALGTMLASEALGLDAPPGRVLTDAALGLPAGALAGLVTGGLVAGLIYLPTAEVEYNLLPALIGGGVGILTAVGVSSVVASRRVEASPVPLRAPMGESGAGLSLRIAL